MALSYKLEYFKGVGGAADEGVYIQIRSDPPAYQTLVTKEDYINEVGNVVQSDFMDGLFAIDGVVRAASQAWRVYIEKSPVFTWEEVLADVLPYIAAQCGESGTTKLAGSDVNLGSENDRRSTS